VGDRKGATSDISGIFELGANARGRMPRPEFGRIFDSGHDHGAVWSRQPTGDRSAVVTKYQFTAEFPVGTPFQSTSITAAASDGHDHQRPAVLCGGHRATVWARTLANCGIACLSISTQ